MNKRVFTLEQDGFVGAYYPNPSGGRRAMIAMFGDSSEDRMAVSGTKWIHRQSCHCLAMSPAKKDYGHHNYPLERFCRAIEFLNKQGCDQIGMIGASTTGMLALIAASYIPQISLTVAFSPSDFVMEGFYRDGKDGMRERPGDGESTVSWQGKPLPYLPYAYRHPEYWRKIVEESKERGDKIASRSLFDESERRHPIREEEKIKVERIQGKVICVGAEDDVLWDTCKYIRRMEARLRKTPHECKIEPWIYTHGTHFAFPQSMLKNMLPIGSDLLVRFMFKAGREYSKECRQTRLDIDQRLQWALQNW
ncbi:MAG: acyl-CoA thioester hydrolase [Clostridia bacterium]|nr:acyl-CoA thioester hydrolase [Clostridia bacterium]